MVSNTPPPVLPSSNSKNFTCLAFLLSFKNFAFKTATMVTLRWYQPLFSLSFYCKLELSMRQTPPKFN